MTFDDFRITTSSIRNGPAWPGSGSGSGTAADVYTLLRK